jgi:hypothetical protein
MEFGARRSFVKAFGRFRPVQLGKISVELMPLPTRVPILEEETHNPQSDPLWIRFCAEEPVEQCYSETAFQIFCDPRAKALIGVKVYGLNLGNWDAIQKRLRGYFDEYLRSRFGELFSNDAPKLSKVAQFDLESRKSDFFIDEVNRICHKIVSRRALSASAS